MSSGRLGQKYRITGLLGQGGMGAVYAAIDETTGTRVAIKCVLAGNATSGGSDNDERSRRNRFQREARAASAIQSDHVARVLDGGTDDESGQPYMVMELLEGEDLQRVLKRLQVLPAEVVLRVASQACKGLAAAHEARVIHRDIKPGNLFLARGEGGALAVKILDFGIAKQQPDTAKPNDATALTRTGSMLGSLHYMSPEQARGRRTLDHRTDVWSLGMVLYRALTGHLPHEDAEAMGDFIILLCSEPPRPVREIAPWVPENVASVIERALQLDQEKRYPSAAAMGEAIRACLPNGDHLVPEMLVAAPPEVITAAGVKPDKTPDALHTPLPDGLPATPAASAPSGEADGATLQWTGNRPSGAPFAAPPAPSTPVTAPGTIPRDTSTASGPSSLRDEALNNSTGAQVSPTMAPRKQGTSVAAGVGIVLAVGLGAFAIVRALSPASGGAAAGTDVTARPETTTAPTSTAEAASRVVTLVVLPGDASAQVDGTEVSVRDGAIELRGAVGSTHRVKLAKEGREIEAEITVTDSGARPAKIELPAAPAPSASSASTSVVGGPKGTAAPKKTGTPATSGAPTTTKNPLIPERFE